MSPKVLVVLTSQAEIPANRARTGWYLVRAPIDAKIYISTHTNRKQETPNACGSPYIID